MWKVNRLVLALAVLALTGGRTQAKVIVDYDPTVDFSSYKTFAWREGTPAKNPLVEKKIRAAIERELVAKGFKEVRESPDLYIVTHASVDTERQIDVTDYGYWQGYQGWRYPRSTTVEVWEFEVGTVIVDILDARTEELIWRGEGTGNVAKTPEKRDLKINRGAAKMFKKFPPK